MARVKPEQSQLGKTIFLSVLVYVVWVFATYMLEGRINLFHRYDPAGRILFIVVANFIVGLGGSFLFLRYAVRSGALRMEKIGLRPLARTLIFVFVFGAVGLGLFIVQKPASLESLVVLNGFAQVLPVSIAEVVVCWAVIGTSFETLTKKGGAAISLIIAIVAADFFFGIYHFAHSAPFNQVRMVFFLMIPGFATSLVYFLVRDLYAAIAFHNFMGMCGVMQSADLEEMSRPSVPLYVIALVSILILVCLDVFLIRR
jgi:hypothetical protein